MKTLVKFFLVLLLIALFASMLIACDKNNDEIITISFETNGGLEVPDVTIKAGEDFEVPTPTKAGYTFIGWFEDSALQTDFEGIATYNIALFAKWEVNQNTLNFDANGGSGTMSSIVMATDAVQNLPANAFEKTDYVFAGWATSATGDVVYANQASYTMGPQSQYTLFAKWALAISLIFDANGGSGTMEPIQVGSQQTFALPQNAFSKTGYIFEGWATSASGEAVYADKASIETGTSDITLYAVWVDIATLVTFEDDYILFGEYPQSLASTEAVAAMGTTTDAKGYYTSAYDDAKYAKVTAVPAAPFIIERYDSMFDDRTLINSGEEYYFKVEPIKWRILAQEDGQYTLLADNILDCSAFDTNNSIYWHESEIRTWLNDGFLNAAFNNRQKTIIQNSTITTIYDEYNDEFDVDHETNDYVFLPSFEDMTNVEYGFPTTLSEDSSRQAYATEYTRAKGAFVATLAKDNNYADMNFGKGVYLTRSQFDQHKIWLVKYIGMIEQTNPNSTENGIRPMMVLTIPQ